jgi:hypothetical protein
MHCTIGMGVVELLSGNSIVFPRATLIVAELIKIFIFFIYLVTSSEQ